MSTIIKRTTSGSRIFKSGENTMEAARLAALAQSAASAGIAQMEMLIADAEGQFSAIDSVQSPRWAAAFEAEDGSIIGGIDQRGIFRIRGVQAGEFNRNPAYGLITRRTAEDAGLYHGGLHFLPWCGQSLQIGDKHGANLTTAQEYGVIAFPMRSAAPTSYAPAVASSTSITGATAYGASFPGGEMPMFGVSYLGELLEARDGIRIDQIGLRPLVACDATGGTTIAGNMRGSANFSAVLGQVTAAKSIAATEGWPLVARAVMWNQGEADDGSGYDAYLASLVSLQGQYDTDIRAITGGTSPIKLILNQTNSVTGNRSGVARAQFDAAAAHTDIVMSTPKYMCDFFDIYHYYARDAKWIGAYDTLAYLAEVIEGQAWKPLSFAVEQVIGNHIFLRAQGRHGPLVIDEDWLPPMTTSGMVRGWSARDGALNPIAVSAVDLAGDGCLRITLASYAAGYRLGYAIEPTTAIASVTDNRKAYVGGAGNIRDSMGDSLPIFAGAGVNRPMHKWAVAQEIML